MRNKDVFICRKKISVDDIEKRRNFDSDTLFIMIHGYASYINDLLPLEAPLREKGHDCTFIEIEKTYEGLMEASLKKWSDKIERIIDFEKKVRQYKKIYVICFSIGLPLILNIIKRRKGIVDGIACISGFCDIRNKIKFGMLRFINKIGIKNVKRFPNVTKKTTRKELCYFKKIPTSTSISVIEDARNTINGTQAIDCPIILFHSMDDNLADYNACYNFYKRLKAPKKFFIKVRGLNHFMQFDIEPTSIINVIEHFFGMEKNHNNNKAYKDKEMARIIYQQSHEEHRFWSDIMFKLIFGFFSIFGVFIYYTLPDIINETDKGKYFLVSYPFIINIYIFLGAMYYSYILRKLAYIKNYVENSIRYVIPPIYYRHNKFLSSRSSTAPTRMASIFLFGVPIAFSIFAEIAFIFKYGNLVFELTSKYIVLKSWFFTSVFSFFPLIYSIYNLYKFSAEELWGYRMPSARFDGNRINELVLDLYDSIHPGLVKINKFEN